MFEIDLQWPVASRYVVHKANTVNTLEGKGDRSIFVPRDATIRLCRPLDQNPSLYAQFASLDGSEQACLRFAENYGTLIFGPQFIRWPTRSTGEWETLGLWRSCIKGVRDIIRRCELSRDNPREAFRQFGKRDKRLFGVKLTLSVKSAHSLATVDVDPETLFAALELQAIQSILAGRRSHQCIECSNWFEIGAGARRSLAKFCSTRCKDSYHNRLKAQARRK
jgi:hypothetical protein